MPDAKAVLELMCIRIAYYVKKSIAKQVHIPYKIYFIRSFNPVIASG